MYVGPWYHARLPTRLTVRTNSMFALIGGWGRHGVDPYGGLVASAARIMRSNVPYGSVLRGVFLPVVLPYK